MANKLPTFIQSGTSNYQTPVLSYNRLATDLITPGFVGTLTNTSGVAPMTGSFGINAQGSPNMSVVASLGSLYLTATPTGGTAQTLSVNMTASETINIASNSSGSTVYDFIYMVMDPTAMNNPAVTGLNVASFFTSRSTTPYSAGGANFGNSNGAVSNSLPIAVVTVANNAVSITNANITDARVNVTLPVNSVGTTSLASASVTSPKLAPTWGAVNTATGTIVNASTDYFSAATLSITVPAGGSVMVWISGWVQINAAAFVNTWISVDGVKQVSGFPYAGTQNPNAGQMNAGVAIGYKVTGLSAGAHTIGFVANSNVGNISQVSASIMALVVGN